MSIAKDDVFISLEYQIWGQCHLLWSVIIISAK